MQSFIIYPYQSLLGKISLKIFNLADLSEAPWPLSLQGLSAFMPVVSLNSQPRVHWSSTTVPLAQAKLGMLNGESPAKQVHKVGECLAPVQSSCHPV